MNRIRRLAVENLKHIEIGPSQSTNDDFGLVLRRKLVAFLPRGDGVGEPFGAFAARELRYPVAQGHSH
jgi:hypothetical protein